MRTAAEVPPRGLPDHAHPLSPDDDGLTARPCAAGGHPPVGMRSDAGSKERWR